jgi:hypothetical protein
MSAVRLGFCALGLALAAVPAGAADRLDAPLSTKAQKALEGRTAGAPISCLRLGNIRSSMIVDATAVIYKESSKRWYVNRLDHGQCTPLRPDRTLVTRLSIDQLCDLDIVRVVDMTTPMEFGACGLGKFVPYTK